MGNQDSPVKEEKLFPDAITSYNLGTSSNTVDCDFSDAH